MSDIINIIVNDQKAPVSVNVTNTPEVISISVTEPDEAITVSLIEARDGQHGETGPQGPQGIKGDTGPQGIQGIQGIQGVQGDTGPAGPKGDTGDQGIQGIQGIQGPQGIHGEKGEKGDAGADGVSWEAMTFNTSLDFGNGRTTSIATIVDATMSETKIIQAFFTDKLEEVVIQDLRVAEKSRSAGVGFEIIGAAPNGASGIYPVRIITSGV